MGEDQKQDHAKAVAETASKKDNPKAGTTSATKRTHDPKNDTKSDSVDDDGISEIIEIDHEGITDKEKNLSPKMVRVYRPDKMTPMVQKI